MRAVAILAALFFGLLIAGEIWLWAQQPPRIDPPPQANAAGAAQDGLLHDLEAGIDLAPLETFDVVDERPLFIEGRRPPPDEPAQPQRAPPPPPPPPPKRPPPRLSLSGIMIIENERLALLRNPPKEGPSKLRKGDEFQGWVVDEIQADRLFLRQGGEREEVKLWAFKSVPLPAAPVQGKPPAQPRQAPQPDQAARQRAQARTRPRPNVPVSR